MSKQFVWNNVYSMSNKFPTAFFFFKIFMYNSLKERYGNISLSCIFWKNSYILNKATSRKTRQKNSLNFERRTFQKKWWGDLLLLKHWIFRWDSIHNSLTKQRGLAAHEWGVTLQKTYLSVIKFEISANLLSKIFFLSLLSTACDAAFP